jgi:hypothetical protein
MLIDLYAEVQLDVTFGVPLDRLRQGSSKGHSTRKSREVGVYAIWSLKSGSDIAAAGEWTIKHRLPLEDNIAAWEPFWGRLSTLKNIGALWYEPWVFDGEETDAEPLMPVDPGVFFTWNPLDDEAKLTLEAYQAAQALISDQGCLLERHDADVVIPLLAHRRTPALRGVARLRVEPDTPGRRLMFKQRRTLIENHLEAFRQLQGDAAEGRFNRPTRSNPVTMAPKAGDV